MRSATRPPGAFLRSQSRGAQPRHSQKTKIMGAQGRAVVQNSSIISKNSSMVGQVNMSTVSTANGSYVNGNVDKKAPIPPRPNSAPGVRPPEPRLEVRHSSARSQLMKSHSSPYALKKPDSLAPNLTPYRPATIATPNRTHVRRPEIASPPQVFSLPTTPSGAKPTLKAPTAAPTWANPRIQLDLSNRKSLPVTLSKKDSPLVTLYRPTRRTESGGPQVQTPKEQRGNKTPQRSTGSASSSSMVRAPSTGVTQYARAALLREESYLRHQTEDASFKGANGYSKPSLHREESFASRNPREDASFHRVGVRVPERSNEFGLSRASKGDASFAVTTPSEASSRGCGGHAREKRRNEAASRFYPPPPPSHPPPRQPQSSDLGKNAPARGLSREQSMEIRGDDFPPSLQIHRRLFDEVIRRDEVFGPQLAQLRHAYESSFIGRRDALLALKREEENEDLRAELGLLKLRMVKAQRERNEAEKKVRETREMLEAEEREIAETLDAIAHKTQGLPPVAGDTRFNGPYANGIAYAGANNDNPTQSIIRVRPPSAQRKAAKPSVLEEFEALEFESLPRPTPREMSRPNFVPPLSMETVCHRIHSLRSDTASIPSTGTDTVRISELMGSCNEDESSGSESPSSSEGD